MTPDPDQMQDKIDDLKDGIDDARRKAEEHGTIPDSTPEPTFIDPDGDGNRNDADEDPGTTMGF
jgi:hypothetical protein